jgi:hypothetical protein
MNGGTPGRIGLVFQWDDEGAVEVLATLTPGNDPSGNGRHPRLSPAGAAEELSERILDALVDDHGGDVIGDVHRAWLRVRRQEHSG